MNTDRELLESAAKAVGYEWDKGIAEQRSGIHCAGLWVDGVSTSWNPLQNDGHALRLAVKLNMHVECDFDEDPSEVRVYGCWPFETGGITEAAKDDPCAATRRAIVRAAAEIGRQAHEPQDR